MPQSEARPQEALMRSKGGVTREPRFRPSIKRVVVSILSIVCAIVAGLSSTSPWWTESLSGQQASGSIHFLPGGSYTVVANGTTTSFTYDSDNIGNVGSLYQTVLAAAIVAAVLALVAAFLSLLAAMGRIRNPARHATVRNVLVAVAAISVFVAIALPTLQPTLFQNAVGQTTICTGIPGGGGSPCNSFWGSASGSGEAVSWGADQGWYLALTTVFLAVAGSVLWRWSTEDPWRPMISSPKDIDRNSLDRVM